GRISRSDRQEDAAKKSGFKEASMKRLLRILVLLALIAAAVRYYAMRPGPSELVLTGIVTTDDVIVSPQIAGRIASLQVKEGESVSQNQLIATIDPGELRADQAYYAHSVAGFSSQVQESEAALRYQERQTEDQISQAEATLASMIAQQAESVAALENTKINLDRSQALANHGIATGQQLDQARTSYDAAKAHVDAINKQVEAQKAAVLLAKANAEQVSMKQGQLATNEHQREAALAQRAKADVRLSYSDVRAPIA